MVKQEYDLIIVGGGLAGSVLAFLALERKLSVAIIHTNIPGEAWPVSAGLINPVTGKRYVKSYNFDILKDVFLSTYHQIEQLTNQNLFSQITIVQSLLSIQEENEWLSRCSDPEYAEILSFSNSIELHQINKQHGTMGLIHGAYKLNIQNLITSLHIYFKDRLEIMQERFEHGAIKYLEKAVSYKGIKGKYIVFTEGIFANYTMPVLKNVLIPLKGDVLIIEAELFDETVCLKDKYQIIPFGDNRYWVGSQYQRKVMHVSADAKAIADIEDFLQSNLNCPYKIIAALSGIRPSTIDRKPLVGEFGDNPHCYILNGFGTKGASLAPWCASILLDLICDKKPIPVELDVQRFKPQI